MFPVFSKCIGFIFCDLTSKSVKIAVGLLLFTDLMQTLHVQIDVDSLRQWSFFCSEFNDRHKNRRESERNICGVTESVTVFSVKNESSVGGINRRMHLQNVWLILLCYKS